MHGDNSIGIGVANALVQGSLHGCRWLCELVHSLAHTPPPSALMCPLSHHLNMGIKSQESQCKGSTLVCFMVLQGRRPIQHTLHHGHQPQAWLVRAHQGQVLHSRAPSSLTHLFLSGPSLAPEVRCLISMCTHHTQFRGTSLAHNGGMHMPQGIEVCLRSLCTLSRIPITHKLSQQQFNLLNQMAMHVGLQRE